MFKEFKEYTEFKEYDEFDTEEDKVNKEKQVQKEKTLKEQLEDMMEFYPLDITDEYLQEKYGITLEEYNNPTEETISKVKQKIEDGWLCRPFRH